MMKYDDELDTESKVWIGVVGKVPLKGVDAAKNGLTSLGVEIIFLKMSVDPLWIVRRKEED